MIHERRGTLQLIGVANLIFCVLLLVFSVPFFWRQEQVLRAWPESDAQVLRSEVVVDRLSQHEQLYSSKLKVLYSVDGKPIVADLTSFQDRNYEKTLRRQQEFAVGSHHPVRYDPRNPSQARIGAGWNRGFFALPLVISGVGGFFGFVAVVLFVAARRFA